MSERFCNERNLFSRIASDKTPCYDDNQEMHQLDLSDPRLARDLLDVRADE